MKKNINISKIVLPTIILILNASVINSQNKKNSETINFTEHTVATNFDRVSGLFVADIDKDNDQDIIGAAINSNEVALWRNDGGYPIQWTKEVIDDNYGGAIYLCAEDINGDGHIDVIATAAIDHQVCWWSNDGGVPIQWTKHLIVSNYTEAHGIMAIDLDKDQKMDIISTAAALNKITWWKNETGSGTSWIEQTVDNNFNYTQSVCAGDFNLDGHTDIVAAALNAHQIAWYKNDDGNPIQWTKNTIASNFSMAHSVEVCEINGDSLPDILGAAYGVHEIAYWQNMGGNPITWEKHSIDNSYSGPLEVCAADMDCDGDIDVAGTAGIGGQVAWWSNESGNPIQWVKHLIASNFNDAWPLSLADIDNDGDIDVVAGSSSLDEIRWWENNYYNLDFTSDCLTGHAPLTVKFSEVSNTLHPITSWNWDFDYDGIFDSNLQNPSFEYSLPGTYTVRLDITMDSQTHTIIKQNYIDVFDGKSAIQFNTNEDYCYFPAVPAFNLTENFTIELVPKPNDWGNQLYGSTIFDKSAIRLFIIGNSFGLMGNYTLGVDLILDDGTKVKLSAPDSLIDLDTWQHIAVSYNASLSQCKIYINGVERTVSVIGSNQASGTLLNNENDPINLGNDLELIFNYVGALDEFRLWSVIRTGSEILENMSNGLTGNESGLIGYWKMDEGNGTEMIDMSATGNNGQIESAVYTQGADLSTLTGLYGENNKANLSQEFILKQNYPNPFNPTTTIKYEIPELSFTTLKVYDVLGNELKTLVSEEKPAGNYSTEWNAKELPSGVFIYRLIAGNYTATKKMLLLK